MPDGNQRAAEEFYSLCLSNARTLDTAARRAALAGDPVTLVACAWGADIHVVQAVVWERIMVASPAPQRQFFRVAEALFSGLHPHAPVGGGVPTCADVVAAARESLLAACEPALRGNIQEGWADLSYAAGVGAPTSDDVDARAAARLEGLSPDRFIARRREQMTDAMADAQSQRVRGETVGAIQRAYEADFLGLEAYLVESAVAAGDLALMSVTVRWELASESVAQLPGLPDGFVAAVARIREALGGALPEPDAARLRAALLPV